MSNKNPLEIVILWRKWEGGEKKNKLNKTIKLLLDCDALNLIRLIKNNRKGVKNLREERNFERIKFAEILFFLVRVCRLSNDRED